MSSIKSAGAHALALRRCALALVPVSFAATATAGLAQSRNYNYQSPRQTYGYSGWDAPAIPVWQGGYGGVHFGYGFGGIDAGSPVVASVDNNGGIGGIHLGYNWQQGQIVFGVEGDLGATWSTGNRNANGIDMSASTAWLASLRGRIGYSFGSAMIYATGGAALARTSVAVSDWSWAGKADDVLLGWAIGAGLEYKLAPNISTRVEALHYRFNDKEIVGFGGTVPYSADQTVIRAGLTLHLR